MSTHKTRRIYVFFDPQDAEEFDDIVAEMGFGKGHVMASIFMPALRAWRKRKKARLAAQRHRP